MMSSQDCSDQAATCDARAESYEGARAAADWEEMARQWRLLAADGDPSRTLARLMPRAKPLMHL
jgi:hypothetical protein